MVIVDLVEFSLQRCCLKLNMLYEQTMAPWNVRRLSHYLGDLRVASRSVLTSIALLQVWLQPKEAAAP